MPETAPLSPDQILNALSLPHAEVPVEVLRQADAHSEQLAPALLDALETGVTKLGAATEAEALRFSYALYLLAKWREPRALTGVCKWLSLPPEQPFEIGGDVTTMDGARILAGVSRGDAEPIKRVILAQEADEYGRSGAINALALLAQWGDVPREEVASYFLWLATTGLERTPSQVWDGLCGAAADMRAVTVFPALRWAYAEGLIDEKYMALEELDEIERGLHQRAGGLPIRGEPISDVAAAIAWWNDFHIEPEREDDVYRHTGRNEPCPCGSGKKFKKCHGR